VRREVVLEPRTLEPSPGFEGLYWSSDPTGKATRALSTRVDEAAKRVLDVVVAALLLLLLTPVMVFVAAAIKLDSHGPLFFRCRRVGFRGRAFDMLKFRKMRDGARGSTLTARADPRFTRIGGFLAKTKLDEIPQLWNVLRGEMSLVGPRPEDPSFVAVEWEAYSTILRVRPGITGLSQLAFARETEILDPTDGVAHYLRTLLPQKARLDGLYVLRRSVGMDLGILFWTLVVVLLRRDVVVNRGTARLGLRRRPSRPVAGPELGEKIGAEAQQ
jgi:lipopolysaccharide/colanic/teichoic acid biosynthesis glycosyltransferase